MTTNIVNGLYADDLEVTVDQQGEGRAVLLLHLAPGLNRLDLSDEHSSALAVNEATDALCLAARDLTRAVDQLPVNRKPKGWNA